MRLLLTLIALFGLELCLGAQLSQPEAAGDDIPAPPGLLAAKAASLGEDSFFFRTGSLMLQHAGNLNGAIVPYCHLSYPHLRAWLARLEQFDGEAEITPTMAAMLYGSSQNGADTAPVIDYLEARALAQPVNDWRWLGQAVYLARYRLQDQARAQELAHELATMPIALPAWARDLELFVMVDRGDKAGAKHLLAALADQADTPNEQQWARHYQAVLAAAP